MTADIMIYRYRWWLLIFFVAGIIILSFPDKGKPVIKLNAMHGPSLLDIAGLLLICIGWLGSILIVIQSWQQLIRKQGERLLFTMVFIYLISIAGVIAGLNLSMELMLWLSVIAAASMNLLLVIAALQVANKRS